jgi:hypothetical protein
VTLATLVLYSLLLQDSVAFRVELPHAAHPGEPVPIVLRLTNRTERPLDLTLQGRPLAFDVTVTNQEGSVIWRRLEGAVVPSILALRTLKPAESLTFEATWDGRDRRGRAVPPGRYLVAGALPTDTPEGLVTQPVTLVLLAHRSAP